MARIKLDLPADFPFAAELRVRITDINYGGHMGNDCAAGPAARGAGAVSWRILASSELDILRGRG
jgi:hypothetical protein